jgi:hypothetical protein
MNVPPQAPPPGDPHDVMKQQARLEQFALEAKLEVFKSQRKRKEVASSRRAMLFLVFAFPFAVFWLLMQRGYDFKVTIPAYIFTQVALGAWWINR